MFKKSKKSAPGTQTPGYFKPTPKAKGGTAGKGRKVHTKVVGDRGYFKPTPKAKAGDAGERKARSGGVKTLLGKFKPT